MLLSSIRRLRVHVMGMQAAPLTVSLNNDRLLSQWLVAASNAIEKYCDREFELKARTEYFDLIGGRRKFAVLAPPVSALTSVYMDSSGLWNGTNESIIDDCFPFGSFVNTPYSFDWQGAKAIRIIYTGGLAAHAVNSTFTLANVPTGVWAAGAYVRGASSGAVGIVVSYTAGTQALVVENYYGVFTAGETLNQTVLEDGTGTVTASGTLGTITAQSLAEAHPAIVLACEALVRYWWKHTTDCENTNTHKDGTTSRRDLYTEQEWPFTPEVRQLLAGYMRTVCL